MDKIICVTGPTACGKTRMGVALAKRFGGEVVSVDSMQIYRGLSIASAAPTQAEMEGIPHHMVAVADPREDWSAARFTQAADRCVQEILARGRMPVLVGGTGLYLESIVAGRSFPAGQAGGEVRRQLTQRLEREGAAPLYAELQAVDPEAAARISPNDAKRLLRALEISLETGETVTAHARADAQRPPKYDAAWLGLAYADRAHMRRQIDLRADAMAAAGLLEEIRALAALDLPPGATICQAIGYKELLPVLRGEISLEAGLEEVKLRSRQYAKRQLTWLRRRRDIHWIFWDDVPNLSAGLQDATDLLTVLGYHMTGGQADPLSNYT